MVIVAIGAVISRRRGARVHYLDEWTLPDGEQRVLEDPGADFYVVTRLGQAKIMSFARRRRSTALVTDRTLVIAMKAFLSKRRIITHVIGLAPGGAPEEALSQLNGGLYTKGYVVLSARPDGITPEVDGSKSYVRIAPDATASATNVEHLRLYCDDTARLCAALGAPAASVAG